MAEDSDTPKSGACASCCASGGDQWKYVVVLLAAIAVAAIVFFSGTAGPTAISLAEFKGLLASANATAVVQDLRGIPANDSSRGGIMNCAIQASGVLSMKGKNVSNYAFDDSGCYGGASSGVRAVSDCLKEIQEEGRLSVTLRYNAGASRTVFTKAGAAYEGDSAFLGNCSIVGYVS